MKTIWKGAISFGLVNIPVGLYSATKSSKRIKFRMLRDSDKSPIKYKRVAEADDKEVPWEHIVKGYEYEKGNFLVMTDEDFERVNINSNQTVDIKEFVDLDAIDPMFFDQPYFLVPEKSGAKAYALLRDALQSTGKVGIAKVVIKTREHVAAVKSLGKVLVLELMHFPDELADPNDLPLPEDVDLSKKEREMAQSLIEAMAAEWEPDKYGDEYTDALKKVIEEKIERGDKPLPGQKPSTPRLGKVVDLVALLQKSLSESKKPKTKTTDALEKQKRHRKAA